MINALLTGGGQQETEWVYGITTPVVSNDVVKEMRHPDASTGSASTTEKDSYTYNQLGQVLTKTDRNGTVHTYTYDILGRQTIDAVTTLGSGVDGSVRRVESEYDGQGNVFKVTAYSASTGGSVVNQIQREFDGLGQMTTEWQAVSGSVNTSTTPKVQYAYSFAPSGSTNHSRLTSVTYPNGRSITYNYATGLDADTSRLSSITDGSTTLEDYTYLGYGTVVKRGHAEPGVDLTYIKLTGESNGDGGDQYAGLDRFGRIVDQRWTTSGGTAKDRWTYGHDRNSNRLYKENLVDSTRSELYAYDNLNQLTSMQRGTLNGTKTGLTGAASRSQSWDFDALGNFDSQTTDGSAQTRTHNKQNEITAVAGATTPTYDANGNLTTDETGRTFKYDSWNRLVQVKNSGGTTLADYTWDGLGRRVTEVRSGTTTTLYYSSSWQVLEERVGSVVKGSYVWSPVYVDAMIARDRDTDVNGTLDERLYAVHDANFNVTALIDTTGAVVERYAYDSFGAVTYLSAAWTTLSASAYDWQYLHQGGRLSGHSGLVHFRNRELSVTLGRWTTNDPIGFEAGDVNWVRYNGNNAVNAVDPSGLWNRESVWNRLSPAVRAAWVRLAKDGWRIVATADSGTATAQKAFSDFLEDKANVRIDVYNEPFLKRFARGADVQWLKNEWAVDFSHLRIWIDDYSNCDAADRWSWIITKIDKGRVAKAGRVIDYRVDMYDDSPGMYDYGTRTDAGTNSGGKKNILWSVADELGLANVNDLPGGIARAISTLSRLAQEDAKQCLEMFKKMMKLVSPTGHGKIAVARAFIKILLGPDSEIVDQRLELEINRARENGLLSR